MSLRPPRDRAVATRRRRVLATLLLVATIGLAPVRAAEAPGAVVAYATAADAVVVRYVEVLGEIEDVEAGPVLTIYGDGRATVRYPRYMKRAGEYAAALDRAEVDALVASLAAKGVAGFQAAVVREQVRAAESARAATLAGEDGATLFVVTDPSTTVIELALDAYTPPGGGAPLSAVRGRAVWAGLDADVARYPALAALADLAAARAELRAVMERVYAEAAQ